MDLAHRKGSGAVKVPLREALEGANVAGGEQGEQRSDAEQ
jgi:hypothetical protein